jgi:hypothetical protein
MTVVEEPNDPIVKLYNINFQATKYLNYLLHLAILSMVTVKGPGTEMVTTLNENFRKKFAVPSSNEVGIMPGDQKDKDCQLPELERLIL